MESDRKRDLVHRDHELFLIINSSANQALVSSQMRGSIDGLVVALLGTSRPIHAWRRTSPRVVFIFVGESLLEFGRQLSDHRRLARLVFSSRENYIYMVNLTTSTNLTIEGQLDVKHFEVVVAVAVHRPTMHESISLSLSLSLYIYI
jgi:hypothetical protein